MTDEEIMNEATKDYEKNRRFAERQFRQQMTAEEWEEHLRQIRSLMGMNTSALT